MPWKVVKKESRYCVHKLDAEGMPMSDPVACHDSEEQAMSQMRALYASEHEGKSAVKFSGADERFIEGWGMPFGGKDLENEFFDADTDFCFEWFTERPLLYHHGLNKSASTTVIGRVKSWAKQDLGVWVQAELDAHNEYVDGVKELIRKGALGFSSGAMAHLVRKDAKSGQIKVWPWIELSTTPTPCNLTATVDFAAAKSHFKAIGIDLDEEAMGAKALTTADMPDHEEHHDKPVEREPAMKTPTMMMRKMAEEMGMHPSEEEMQAMMAEMGDMAGMSEEEMQQKMRQVLAKHKSGPDLMALVGRLADEGIEPKTLDTLPLATHAEAVKILTVSLLERTKDLRERRIKEGRQFSQPHRERLRAANEALKTATGEMAAFLDSTDPAKAEKARLQFELLKLYSATI